MGAAPSAGPSTALGTGLIRPSGRFGTSGDAAGVDVRGIATVPNLTTATRMLLAACSGVLGWLSFPTASLTPLVFISMVPLLVAISGSRSRQAPSTSLRTGFTLGWLTGAVGLAGAFRWALPTIARFEHFSVLFAVPFFLLFVGYYAVQLGLFAAGVAWMSRQRPAAPILFTAAWWVILEWGFPKIVPWSFGDTLAASPLLRQGADLYGVYGLSFFILIVNACCAAAVTEDRMPPGRRLRLVAVAATLLLAAGAYGALRLHEFAAPADNQLSVTVVQGGLHSGRDDLGAANEEAWSTYSSLSTQNASTGLGTGSAGGTDLLVWPETVLRVYLRQDDAYRARVVDFVRRLQRPLFVGSLDQPRDGPGELNSGYLVQPGPSVEASMQIYHKLALLPFGEYVPGTNLLPFLSHWQTTGRFVPGATARPVTLQISHRGPQTPVEHDARARLTTTSFAPSICFEAVRPGAFNQLVRAGSEFLVNLTDDGWFGDTAGPYQHLQAATLRAVETRRWLVRASNSGVSAFVDPTGRIVDSLPLGAIGVLRHGVTPSRVSSIYVRYGNWPITLAFALVFGSLVTKWSEPRNVKLASRQPNRIAGWRCRV